MIARKGIDGTAAYVSGVGGPLGFFLISSERLLGPETMYRRVQRTRKKELHRSTRNSRPHIFLRLRLDELSQTSAPLRSDPDPLAPFD
jgi:hypothetical protein